MSKYSNMFIYMAQRAVWRIFQLKQRQTNAPHFWTTAFSTRLKEKCCTVRGRKLIRWRNLSFEAHRVSRMEKSHTSKHTRKHTHKMRPYARDIVRLEVCLHHIRVLACSFPPGDKKRSLLCVDSYCSHPHLAPPGFCRGAGKQNHIHTAVYVFPDSPFFFSSNLIFFLALPPAHLLMLIWFSSFLSGFSRTISTQLCCHHDLTPDKWQKMDGLFFSHQLRL